MFKFDFKFFCVSLACLAVFTTGQDMEMFDSSASLDQYIDDFLRFNPNNVSFYKLPELILNLIGVELVKIQGNELVKHSECAILPMDPQQRYTILRTIAGNSGQMISVDVKPPFSNVFTINSIIIGKRFCIAFNRKNYGIGFEILKSMPCMSSSNDECGLKLRGIALSLESKLVDDSKSSLNIFDGFRYQYIPRSNDFSMLFRLSLPLNEPGLTSNKPALFTPLNNHIKLGGFYFKATTDLAIFAQTKPSHNLFYFRTRNLVIDLYIKDIQLLKIDFKLTHSSKEMELSGAFRDSVSNTWNTCFPSGIFMSYKPYAAQRGLGSVIVAVTAVPFVYSYALFYLFGKNLKLAVENLDAGLYIDFRRSQTNGFYLRGRIRVKLFDLFDVKIDAEIQHVNGIELKRRLMSRDPVNMCPDYEMTEVNKFLMKNFGRGRSSNEWSNFTETGRSSADSNTKYLVGYLKTKAKIYFPFFRMIALSGYVDGVYVVPNPFSRDYLYYMKLDIEVTIYGFIGVNLIMTVNDVVSIWECYVELFLVDVGVKLVGGSKWIGLDSIGDIGSLLKEEKSFKHFLIRWGRLVKKLLTKINEKLKALAKALKETWDMIEKDIKQIRDKVKDMTAFLCRSPPCFLSNMLGTMAAIVAGPLVAAANALISWFGKTKTSIVQIGIDEFKCPIWRKTTRRCFWKACKTVRVDTYVDKPCNQQVQLTLLDAKGRDEMANWKEDVVTVNMDNNQGYQHVLAEIEANRDVFEDGDIELIELLHEFPDFSSDIIDDKVVNTDKQRHRRDSFDPTNTTFINEFESSYEQLFKPIDDFIAAPDEAEVFASDQDMRVRNVLQIRTKYLVGKGKSTDMVDISVPIYLDFSTAESLEASIDELVEELLDEKNPLMKTIIGENVGRTEELLDALGMSPPIISLKPKNKLTINCNDPLIDSIFDNGEQVFDRIQSLLTPLKIEEVFKKCRDPIDFRNVPTCSSDDPVCGATTCRFERFIFDGCKQRSNSVYESVTILPVKPFFVKFPRDQRVACDENVDPSRENQTLFEIPIANPGCRGSDVDFSFVDKLMWPDKQQCNERVYREWRADIEGCEDSLFVKRTQKLYVEDKVAPVFSYFPPDRQVEFFENYGSEQMGSPKVYDQCGHGPSSVSYKDRVVAEVAGRRRVEREWSAVDECGNRISRMQIITIGYWSHGLGGSFKNFLSFSFGSIQLNDSLISGETASIDKITLQASRIGQDTDFYPKCSHFNAMCISNKSINLVDSLINGRAISFSAVSTISSHFNFNFTQAYVNALKFSAALNSTLLDANSGPLAIKCTDDVFSPHKPDQYPIQNFLSATCTVETSRQIALNVMPKPLDLDLIGLDLIILKGSELLYNVFWLEHAGFISDRVLVIDVPADSFVIVNIGGALVESLNVSRIDFVENRVDRRSLIFNFVSATKIDVLEGSNEVDGSFMAPRAEFRADKSELVFNGQMFIGSLQAKGLKQTCSLFEPFM